MSTLAPASPEIVLYVARADNRVIGDQGGIPWRLPGEQKRFKAMTMGKPLVMGRRTFDSLPGVLPGRRHIVVTRDPRWTAAGAERAGSVDEALARAGDVPEVAVIGGAEIFALLLPRARRIELTEVHRAVAGDVLMPPLGEGWRIGKRELGGPDWDYVTLMR